MKHGLMSYDIKLVSGGPMPLRQLKHFLMSSVSSFPAPGSWQALPPLILGCYSFLFGNKILLSPTTLFVGQKPPYSLLIRRRNRYRFIIEALSSRSLFPPEMTLATFSAHKRASTRYVKAALCPFVGLKFWHLSLSP